MLNLHNLQMVKGWAKELWQPWATITIDRATSLKSLEVPGIDPGTSRMLSERSTIWATPPLLMLRGMWLEGSQYSIYHVGNTWKQLEVPGTQDEIITGYEWQADCCLSFGCCHVGDTQLKYDKYRYHHGVVKKALYTWSHVSGLVLWICRGRQLEGQILTSIRPNISYNKKGLCIIL